jgi:hypothetical protein
MGRVSTLAVVACVLSACQSARVDTPFDPTAAAFILKEGTGRIEGEAFLRRDYGRLVTAAGERVFLIPATAYAVERFGKMFSGDYRAYFGTSIEDTPPDYYQYRREAKVDMRGRFAFEKLAPGRYIVATRIFWTEPKSYLSRGGAVYDVVEVKADETTTAIISGR